MRSRGTVTQRLCLQNDNLRLEFDPRTSDTMYNYLWVRRPDNGIWMRVHNFGIDVRAPNRRKPHDVINCIGVRMKVEKRDRRARVTYPRPLLYYSDLANAPSLADIHHYPDLPPNYGARLGGANASLEFRYRLDDRRPSFTIGGRVLGGRVRDVVYIVSALWTDNHELPTHLYVEGTRPLENHGEGVRQRAFEIENIAYAIYYRADGLGVPYALLPERPDKSVLYNLYDNSYCLGRWHTASANQDYIPRDPPVTDSNDTGYVAEPDADGALRGVRVAFFPELGWGAGGHGFALVEKAKAAIRANYWTAARSWKRTEKGLTRRWTWWRDGPCDGDDAS